MGYQIFLVVVAIIGVIIVQVFKSERRSRVLNPPRRIGTIPDGYVPQPPPGPGWAQGGPGYQPPPVAHLPSFHPQQPSHQPPPHTLPTPQVDLDDQVRALMAAGNEVGAIRLLCDEAEMGIIAAQEYARALVRAPEPDQQAVDQEQQVVPLPQVGSDQKDEWSFFGSAALGGSPADYDERDEWASGWQEKRDPNEGQFIDELWQSIRDGSNPAKLAEFGREPGTSRDERTPRR